MASKSLRLLSQLHLNLARRGVRPYNPMKSFHTSVITNAKREKMTFLKSYFLTSKRNFEHITVNDAWIEDRMVCFKSDDQKVVKYPGVWIRDNCRCPKCYDPSSEQRTILMKDFDPEVIPKEVKLQDEEVSWFS